MGSNGLLVAQFLLNYYLNWMKSKLAVFAFIFVGNFSMHYFISTRDNTIGEILFVSAGGAAIFALTFNYFKRLGDYIIRKIFK
jgi:hypothetical protein